MPSLMAPHSYGINSCMQPKLSRGLISFETRTESLPSARDVPFPKETIYITPGNQECARVDYSNQVLEVDF